MGDTHRHIPPNPERSTSVKRSPIWCSCCGRRMGTKPGTNVTLGMICDNPICSWQGPPAPNGQRDAFIVAAALAHVSVSQISFETGVSRQRVYQIIDTWKSGV
jgi:hypothetical protein